MMIIKKKLKMILRAKLWESLHVCANTNFCALLKFTENFVLLVQTQNQATVESSGS